jgi:hypothetical protein
MVFPDSSSSQIENHLEPSTEVRKAYSCRCWLIETLLLVQRGEHDIELEITFTNNKGYVFHDSCGFESGNETELEIVQNFVRSRSRDGRLNERLHAIWFIPFLVSAIANSRRLLFRYCIPMSDNTRPSLDLRHFDKICPDKKGTSKPDVMD